MEIRFIKKSEWQKLLAFNQAEYRPDHILTNKTYYDWQFDNFANPDPENYTTIGLFDGKGDLLGTFGRFSVPYNFRGKTVMGNCLANLIVKRNLRNLGFGYLLLEKTSALGDLAIDHTINESAWAMFMKAGWQGENLKRFLYIVRSENALYKVPPSPISKISDKNLDVVPVKEFGEETDIFWNRIKERYPITIERSARYLNWRYAKNPLINYQMFFVKSGRDPNALVILRIEEPRKEKPLGIKVARIIDFVSDKDSEVFALAKIAEYCRGNKIDFIDYFFSGNFHLSALKNAGFVNGDESLYSSIPILFNPVSGKRTHLNFAVKSGPSTSLTDWYTTKGGGDQDRPA